MTYSVKEIFKTLQGEGYQAGRAAVFCRFSGCNLWSGREEDRKSATCSFCDTDFVGTNGTRGGKFESAADLALTIRRAWGNAVHYRLVVFTGGEPLLQLDGALIDAVKELGFAIAIETNGTMAAPPGLDWVCVSPKAGALLRQRSGDELKLVYPQARIRPADFAGLAFKHFWLQPMDGRQLKQNTDLAAAYCIEHPPWRVSLQTHKLMGVP